MPQPKPVASIPGADLYPMGPYMDPSLPVYKPEIARGLLSNSKADELTRNFAGGLLSGYQVRPAQGDLTSYGMGGGLMSEGVPQASPLGHPQAPMPTMVTPVNPSGVYQGQPNPNAPAGNDGGLFGDMTSTDLAKMFLAREMSADPTNLAGGAAVRAQSAQNLLGGVHGLYQAGQSAPQLQRILGIDPNAPASMDDAQAIQNWVARQGASAGGAY